MDKRIIKIAYICREETTISGYSYSSNGWYQTEKVAFCCLGLKTDSINFRLSFQDYEQFKEIEKNTNLKTIRRTIK